MADLEKVERLRAGVEGWNEWRRVNSSELVNLRGAALGSENLAGAKLFGAILADALLGFANLRQASLEMTDLTGASLRMADLAGANLAEATLVEADLSGANLSDTNLSRANLRGANLTGADLSRANLRGANLLWANLSMANLANVNLAYANLERCHIFGISAWKVDLTGAKQTNPRITPMNEPDITVDNLEIAQFLYLVLHNEKIREILDTITSKVVLILGRFSKERKPLLDGLREALRSHPHSYVPVLFDFAGPESRDTTETITLLARMARFVIADLTDPGSVPYELAKIVPDAHIPVKPLLQSGATTFSMAGDLWMAREMLPVYRYTTSEELLAALTEQIIAPAEAKVTEIQRERATALLRSGL